MDDVACLMRKFWAWRTQDDSRWTHSFANPGLKKHSWFYKVLTEMSSPFKSVILTLTRTGLNIFVTLEATVCPAYDSCFTDSCLLLQRKRTSCSEIPDLVPDVHNSHYVQIEGRCFPFWRTEKVVHFFQFQPQSVANHKRTHTSASLS